jgi:hypothetical protein
MVKADVALEDDERIVDGSPVVELTYDRFDVDGADAIGVDRGSFEGLGGAVGAAMGLRWSGFGIGHGMGMYMAITSGGLFDRQSYEAEGAHVARHARQRRTDFRMEMDYAAGDWRGGFSIMDDEGRRELRNATMTSHEGVFEMFLGRSLDGLF